MCVPLGYAGKCSRQNIGDTCRFLALQPSSSVFSKLVVLTTNRRRLLVHLPTETNSNASYVNMHQLRHPTPASSSKQVPVSFTLSLRKLLQRFPMKKSFSTMPHLVAHFSSRFRGKRSLVVALLVFVSLIFILSSRTSSRISHHHFYVPTVQKGFPDEPVPLSAVIVADSQTNASQIDKTIKSLLAQQPALPILVHHFTTGKPNDDDKRVKHVVSRSRRAYANPLEALRTPALYLTAGTKLNPGALQWLIQAREKFASRPDIAGFSLLSVSPKEKVSGADHLKSSWRELRMLNLASDTHAFAYRLLSDGNAFMPNEGRDLKVWNVFSEWLLLRRGDWYRYPRGPGVDGSPLGMSALQESKWKRGAWHVWFSRFLAEYRLAVVYPNVSGTFIAGMGLRYTDEGPFEMESLPVLDAKGQAFQDNKFREETLNEIVKLGAEQGGMISFTIVNKIFLETSRSWFCNVDLAGFRPKGLVWAVTDKETESALKHVNGSKTVLLDEVEGGKETGNEFGNPGYWKLMLERTALITDVLRSGIAVFAFETDAIWLKDPQPYIDELVSQEADIVGTINTRNEVSGNFFYLRPTLATRKLWDEITTEFEKAYKGSHFEKKKSDSFTYIDNDQSLLTKLVLRNDTWRASYPLSFLTLDMELFADGRWYKPDEGFYTSERARNPVLINNNFIIGVEEKKKRAKKWGHWFWDEQRQECLVDTVNKAVHGEGSHPFVVQRR